MKLNQYAQIIRRRLFIILLTVFVTMIVVAIGTLIVTPIYQASTVLRIAASSSAQFSYTDYTYAPRLMNTFVEIVNSKTTQADIVNRLALTSSPVIKAEILPNTELIKITVEHTDPKIAAQAANILAENLIKESAQQYPGGNKTSEELLFTQVAKAKTEMDDAQQAYYTIQSQTLSDTQALESARQTLLMQQNIYSAISLQYSQSVFQSDIQSNEVLAKQVFKVKNDLDLAQQTYQGLLEKSLPNSQLLDNAKQTLLLKQSIYSSLVSQYDQAIFRRQTQANMMTVIETAGIPILPSTPNMLLNYGLGLFIGLAGGLALAFIFENLDTTLYTVEEIERLSGFSAIANIPLAHKGQLNISQNSSSSLAEAFRDLAAGVQLINFQQIGKVLVIMSAEPAQGKSMITANLSLSLAEFGEKVVILDCDFRLPRIHQMFNLKNDLGLVDVLEKGAALQNVIQKTSFGGIKVITSGSITGQPFISLCSSNMAKVIQELKNQFDYVLLDSPALLAVADVMAIAQNVDGLIQVIRQGHSKRSSVLKAGKFLASFPDKFVGLIINQAENFHNSQYYQNVRKDSFQAFISENKLPLLKDK